MPFLGSIIPNSVVGIGQLERAKKSEQKRKTDETDRAAGRKGDGAELSPEAVGEAGAIRSTKSNESEESREDRVEHATYGPQGPQGGQSGGLGDLNLKG